VEKSSSGLLVEVNKDYLVKEIANMFGIEVMNQNLQQATINNMVEGRF
jgi:hypothetical protein